MGRIGSNVTTSFRNPLGGLMFLQISEFYVWAVILAYTVVEEGAFNFPVLGS